MYWLYLLLVVAQREANAMIVLTDEQARDQLHKLADSDDEK
jgi:hypothetical protein